MIYNEPLQGRSKREVTMARHQGPWLRWGFTVAIAAMLAAPATFAQDFYQGKSLRIVVGSDTGGGYDAYARLLAQYWSKYIPGHPQIIVQNMPGAGSLTAMNYMANVAPKAAPIASAGKKGPSGGRVPSVTHAFTAP